MSDWLLEPRLIYRTERQRFAMRRIRKLESPWVFCRTACLGNDVFNLLQVRSRRINVQKGRIDRLISDAQLGARARIPWGYHSALERKDVWPLLVEQEAQWLTTRIPPDFVLMDSYSELTDQYFSGSNGPGFCANFGDVNEVAAREKGLTSNGLIDLEFAFTMYGEFFNFLHNIWPGVPVAFLHFPTIHETRPKYRERACQIREAIRSLSDIDPLLASIEYQPTHPSDPSSADFPYHYDRDVYVQLAAKVRDLL